MKKIFAIIIFMFCYNLSFAQCSYITNKTDKTTGDTILETNEKQLTKTDKTLGLSTSISFMKINDDITLKLKVQSIKKMFTLEKSEEALIFKDINGELIILEFKESISANGLFDSTENITNWEATQHVSLTEEDYKKLINSEIVSIGFNITDGYLNYEVKSKRYDKIRKLLKCIK